MNSVKPFSGRLHCKPEARTCYIMCNPALENVLRDTEPQRFSQLKHPEAFHFPVLLAHLHTHPQPIHLEPTKLWFVLITLTLSNSWQNSTFPFESISSEKLTESLLPGTQIQLCTVSLWKNLSNKSLSLKTFLTARILQTSPLKCRIVLAQLYPQAEKKCGAYAKRILISIILLAAERLYSLWGFFPFK